MTEQKGRGRPRSELTLDDIGEKVLEELQRRLGNVRDASEIPGTQLVQIAQRYLAHLENQKVDEEEEVKLTVLEVIDKEGLALPIRRQILWDYLDEVEAMWRGLSDRLVEMDAQLKEMEEDDDDPVS